METATSTGEYYLEGVREMASGFLLKSEGDFQFFFSYGALDRHGEGKWEEKAGKVIFNSRPKPLADFTLLESKKTSEDFITIKIEGGNANFLGRVFCSLQNGIEGSWQEMTRQGDVQFAPQNFQTISLLWQFCPERFSTIPVTQSTHNEFIFRIEPSIMELFLENFSLQVESDGLTGRHPLLDGELFRYAKQ